MSVAVCPVRRQCPRCQASGFTDHDQGPHGYPVLEGRPMTLLSVLVSTGGTFIRSLLTFTVTPHTRKAPQLLHRRTAGSLCRDTEPKPMRKGEVRRKEGGALLKSRSQGYLDIQIDGINKLNPPVEKSVAFFIPSYK